MKKLLLILASLTTLSASSQTSVYHPFPDSAIVWRQEGYTQGNCCCTGYFCLNEFDYNYFLNGDTLIGAYTYKKIYKTGNGVDWVNGPNTCPPGCTNGQSYYFNNIYSGCFRQDIAQRKIFIVPTGNALETLLYDFNLNLGDTLPPSWPDNDPSVYITAIDSTLVGGSYHKRFHLSTSNFPGEVSLIEGIGNSLGFLRTFQSNMNVSMFYNMLLCVTVNGIPVYPDTATVCALASQINEINDNSDFSIVPNPFSDNLNISLDNYGPAEVTLYDIASKRLFHQMFINSVSINTELLPRGIYICEVRNKNGLRKREKLVKY